MDTSPDTGTDLAGRFTVGVEVPIAVPPIRVWKALIEPEDMRGWFCSFATVHRTPSPARTVALGGPKATTLRSSRQPRDCPIARATEPAVTTTASIWCRCQATRSEPDTSTGVTTVAFSAVASSLRALRQPPAKAKATSSTEISAALEREGPVMGAYSATI